MTATLHHCTAHYFIQPLNAALQAATTAAGEVHAAERATLQRAHSAALDAAAAQHAADFAAATAALKSELAEARIAGTQAVAAAAMGYPGNTCAVGGAHTIGKEILGANGLLTSGDEVAAAAAHLEAKHAQHVEDLGIQFAVVRSCLYSLVAANRSRLGTSSG